ncbi:hypothetical protein [Actinomadura hallensis]|nr:hypothetical protein [Actinomadura hallensis]
MTREAAAGARQSAGERSELMGRAGCCAVAGLRNARSDGGVST